MHWSEIAAIFLIVIGAVAFLAIPAVAALLLGALARDRWRRPEPLERVQTAYGEFIKQDGFWEGSIEWNGFELSLTPVDVGGQPNPDLLARLPQVLAKLSLWERTAREQVPAITLELRLSEIADDGSTDFVLGFSWDEGAWGETVYVEFKDGHVLNWSSVD